MCGIEKIKRCRKENWLHLQFSILGGMIGRRPFCFLLISILISAAFSTGFLLMKINRDVDSLYTDSNGKAADNLRLTESLFPINTSRYNDMFRTTTLGEVAIVFVVAKNGGSVLRKDVIQEITEVDAFIKSYKVEMGEKVENYSALCGKLSGKCVENNLQEVLSNFQSIREGRYKIKYPLLIDNLMFIYAEYGTLLGGVETNSDGYVNDVKAIRILYFVDLSDSSKLEAIHKWQNGVYNYLKNKIFNNSEFVLLSALSKVKSAEALTLEIVEIMPIVAGTIALFSALTCLSDNWVTSKPFLGLAACLSAMLSITSGLGLGFFLGIEYQDSYLAMMYVVLVLEVDDAFVLISSWRNTNHKDTVPKRMEQTFFETAPSITVTSLTNVLSCTIGIATSVPAFQMLSSVVVCCNIFAYINQLIFFGSCLALSGYMEETSTLKYLPIPLPHKKTDEFQDRKKKGDIFMRCFKNSVGKLLTNPLMKLFVILAFLANLAIAIWGWTYVRFGSGLTDIFPPDSFLAKSIEMNYKYFNKYIVSFQIIVKDPLNYADPRVQESIESLLRKFESHPHIADSSMRISWLHYYKIFKQHPVGRFSLSGYNVSNKQDFVDGLHQVFLRMKAAEQFNFDIVFNENYTDIVASRFLLMMKNINSTEVEVQTLKDINEIAANSEIPVEIFGPMCHVLEQAWIIKNMAIQTAVPAIILTCLIFFAFSQNIKCSVCVSLTVLCVICEIVGYFSLWGVKIDLASLIVFVVSIGFSINYTAHMAFAFVTEKNAEANEVIKTSIYKIGFAVTQGAFSSILSLLVLRFKEVYVLTAAFKTLFLISSLTAFHAVFFIPVFLELSGVSKKSAVSSASDGVVKL